MMLSLERGLLGEITPNLRAVTLKVEDRRIDVRCYFQGEIAKEDRESMSCVKTELIADFPKDQVTLEVVHLDAPAPIPKDDIGVYFRRE